MKSQLIHCLATVAARAFVVSSFLTLLGLNGCAPRVPAPRNDDDMRMINCLIERSSEKLSIDDVENMQECDSPMIETAVAYIMKTQDYSAYHLLFFVKQQARQRYSQIPHQVVAKVLCSELENVRTMNDWGLLDEGSGYDGIAATELVALGPVSVSCLKNILDDNRPALVAGSESATMAVIFHYRRSDFAYRYLSEILDGHPPGISKNLAVRDVAIKAMKARLR